MLILFLFQLTNGNEKSIFYNILRKFDFVVKKKRVYIYITKDDSSIRKTQSRKKFRWILFRWRCLPLDLWFFVDFFLFIDTVDCISSTLIHRNARRTRVSKLKSKFDCWYCVCSPVELVIFDAGEDDDDFTTIFSRTFFSFDTNITGLLWAFLFRNKQKKIIILIICPIYNLRFEKKL